jgi:release factor glutamine methyltransferase
VITNKNTPSNTVISAAFAGMTDGVVHLLKEAKRALEARGNPNPALDARLLLQHAAGLSREALIADPDREISVAAAERFHDFLARRLAGEPVSRILGEREFYGRRFKVTPATLDPRPDTETLIEAALFFMPIDAACRIIDLGTGTGAIGVTLLAERQHASAVMTDISAEALVVARENAKRHEVTSRSSFVEGNWFAGIRDHFDLILSNPPYIPSAILKTLSSEVRDFDPGMALDGGLDGLDPYRKIAAAARAFLTPDGRVIVEIGEGQALEIEGIFRTRGFLAERRWSDLAGHIRCLGFAQSGARQKRGWK